MNQQQKVFSASQSSHRSLQKRYERYYSTKAKCGKCDTLKQKKWFHLLFDFMVFKLVFTLWFSFWLWVSQIHVTAGQILVLVMTDCVSDWDIRVYSIDMFSLSWQVQLGNKVEQEVVDVRLGLQHLHGSTPSVHSPNYRCPSSLTKIHQEGFTGRCACGQCCIGLFAMEGLRGIFQFVLYNWRKQSVPDSSVVILSTF